MNSLGILLCDSTYPEIKEKYGTHEQSFIKMFDSIGFSPEDYQVWKCYLGDMPQSIDEKDVWIVSGSKWSAYDNEGWIDELKDFIRKIDHAGSKLLGICFGHQLIHEALGGKVQKSPDGWGLGPYPIKVVKEFESLRKNEEISVLAMHQDQVYKMADRFEVIASCDFCAHAMTIKDSQILTIQAHPEFSSGVFDMICERIRPKAGDDLVNRAISNSKSSNDVARIRGLIRDFLFDTK